MTEYHLHPLAARLRWYFPSPLAPDAWAALLADTVGAVARECQAAGPVVIGHIKALALLPAGGYLRASAISAQHPVDVEAQAAPSQALTELTITLNVIVYGLPFEAARRIVTEQAGRLVEVQGGSAHIEAISEDHHTHDHG
jgi:hypothetical protein